MSNFALIPLLEATWQTIYMVFIASFISIVGGIFVGIALFITQRKQNLDNRCVNQSLGVIVNVVRSIPFIILLIALIPLTRLLVGTSIGTNAAIVPLAIAGIPFFARICESALSEVSYGLIEAAHAMGASNWQLIYKVLIPESLPSLIKGSTLTIIGLIGYSAMAGAVGGGGLGELAINYGYERFNVAVMLETVVLLVILVQIIQALGDRLARKPKLKALTIAVVILWIICIISQAAALLVPKPANVLRVGIMSGVMQNIMTVAQEVAIKRYDLHLQLIAFDDYILPNTALNSGNLDANIFQHVPYLDAQIKARGYQLTPIAKTFVYPMGFYSHKIQNISQLKPGSVIAIPNDPSNEGRALLLLQKYHLIQLKKTAGLFGTLQDIIANPEHLKFKALAAAQLPRVLQDAALVALTNDFVGPAGLTVAQAILREGPDSPYANVIVVRTQDKNNPLFKKLIAVMHSEPVLLETEKAFPNGAAIPAWKNS